MLPGRSLHELQRNDSILPAAARLPGILIGCLQRGEINKQTRRLRFITEQLIQDQFRIQDQFGIQDQFKIQILLTDKHRTDETASAAPLVLTWRRRVPIQAA